MAKIGVINVGAINAVSPPRRDRPVWSDKNRRALRRIARRSHTLRQQRSVHTIPPVVIINRWFKFPVENRSNFTAAVQIIGLAGLRREGFIPVTTHKFASIAVKSVTRSQ